MIGWESKKKIVTFIGGPISSVDYLWGVCDRKISRRSDSIYESFDAFWSSLESWKSLTSYGGMDGTQSATFTERPDLCSWTSDDF